MSNLEEDAVTDVSVVNKVVVSFSVAFVAVGDIVVVTLQ